MHNLDRLDKDELRWSLEDQNDLVQEAIKVLSKIKDGEWNHKECGCSYGCGDGYGDDNIKECDSFRFAQCDCSDDYKLEIYYNAIKEAIRLLE